MINWKSRGNVLLGFVGEIYAFRIIRGEENILESRLPDTWEHLMTSTDNPDKYDRNVENLKKIAERMLDDFILKSGLIKNIAT